MKLRELFDTELLWEMIEKKYVTKRWHPTLPIYILNYTPSCSFDQQWNEVTEQCRGLIADRDSNIIARPLRKFFNLNTPYRSETWYENLPPASSGEVYEKMDGCLGIVWKYAGQVGVATRGSFESEMAKWATDYLNIRYKQWVDWYLGTEFNFPITYVCEIISPVSKIVVEYDFEDLVLLSIVHNETGTEYQYEALEQSSWPGKIVERYAYTLDECVRKQKEYIQNREGYVVFYRDAGLRVKVKFEDYMRLHRLITGVNQKTIYTELLAIVEEAKQYKELRDFRFNDFVYEKLAPVLEGTPDGFQKWYRGWVAKFLKQKGDIMLEALGLLWETQQLPSRSEKAQEIKKYPKLASVTFALLDGNHRKAEQIAWKQIKPKVSSEDVYRRDTDN